MTRHPAREAWACNLPVHPGREQGLLSAEASGLMATGWTARGGLSWTLPLLPSPRMCSSVALLSSSDTLTLLHTLYLATASRRPAGSKARRKGDTRVRVTAQTAVPLRCALPGHEQLADDDGPAERQGLNRGPISAESSMLGDDEGALVHGSPLRL